MLIIKKYILTVVNFEYIYKVVVGRKALKQTEQCRHVNRVVKYCGKCSVQHHTYKGEVIWACLHYSGVIMSTMASQITSLTIVYSTVYSGTDQRKHQSSASLAFVRRIHQWPVNSPHKAPVTQKMFSFDDVIMWYIQHVYPSIYSFWRIESLQLQLHHPAINPWGALHSIPMNDDKHVGFKISNSLSVYQDTA